MERPIKSPYGFDMGNVYLGATGYVVYKGEFIYTWQYFETEQAYIEWFEDNRRGA